MTDTPIQTPAEAWDHLLEQLRAAGEVLQSDKGARTPQEEAEGYRFLLRLLSLAGDFFIENVDGRHPQFTRVITPTRKFFFDNPDTIYDYTPLDGTRRWRVTGTRGTTHYLGFTVYAGSKGWDGANRIVANLVDHDLGIQPDGSFELLLGPAGSWPDETPGVVVLPPDTSVIGVRQYCQDLATEVPATYAITALDEVAPPAPYGPKAATGGLKGTANFVRWATELTAGVGAMLSMAPNTLIHQSGEQARSMFTTPDNEYFLAWYHLQPGEALVIHGTPPAARYWNASLCDRWMESGEWRYRPASINGAAAVREPDGSVRFVVSPEPPAGRGGNWLDTEGRLDGFVLVRWLLADEVAMPTCTLAPLSSLH